MNGRVGFKGVVDSVFVQTSEGMTLTSEFSHILSWAQVPQVAFGVYSFPLPRLSAKAMTHLMAWPLTNGLLGVYSLLPRCARTSEREVRVVSVESCIDCSIQSLSHS